MMIQGGKTKSLYLINRDQLTLQNSHYCATNCGNSDPEIAQELQGATGGLWSSPTYWNNSIYTWGLNDSLKAYSLTNGSLGTTPSSMSNNTLGYPGATPVVSANGTSNGIVWGIDTSQNGTGHASSGPAVLHAYDATNLTSELYNSTQAANNRDQAGNAVKFAVPLVINGKVYVGTTTEVDVYEPLP